jgi:hypothetical protein
MKRPALLTRLLTSGQVDQPRLTYLVSPRGVRTHRAVVRASRHAQVAILTYDEALQCARLPAATYVFTDMDRLSPPQLKLASALYTHLRAHGLSVLNNPARAMSRAGLLRALHDAGINQFNAYRVEDNVRPERWPVFVRAEGSHTAPVSGLLESWDAVRTAVDAAIESGIPVSSMIIIEYAAEPVRPGLFRKLAGFRFGNADFAHNCVHEDNWLVKYGQLGSATPELYRDDLRIVSENPYAEDVARAFDIARIDYGRADFGLVNGKVQVYEINTNPTVAFPAQHPSRDRIEAYAIFRRNYLAALDAASSGMHRASVKLPRPLLPTNAL